MTIPAGVDLLVDAPVAAVHHGSSCATVTVVPEQVLGPVDGALRIYEDGRVVPGLAAQLHDFGAVPLRLGLLPPGWHTLTACYTGGSRYRCAEGAPFRVLVLPAATVTDLLVPPIGVAVGESIAVTVRTTDAACAASGSVTLYEQATAIASGEVLDGFGTIVLPTWLRPGPHRLFAAYAGTETHSPSETPVVSITVRD